MTSRPDHEGEKMERPRERERIRKASSPTERRRRDKSNEVTRRRRSRSNSPVQRKDRDQSEHVRSKDRGDRYQIRQNEDRRHDRVRDDHGRHRAEQRSRREGDTGVQERADNYLEQDGRRAREERTNPSRAGPRPDGPRQRKRRRWERAEEEEDIGQYEFGGGSSQARSSTDGDGNAGDNETTEAKPNYGLSGKLTAETNTYKGVVIKYNEPPEARVPKTRWRLYGFKGDETLPTLYVHRQSAYLIGRNRIIVDMPVDHPSCSGQHAVLQYRLVDYDKEDGTTGRKVKPYIIDLESTNGTYVNNNRIETARFYELKEGDMVKFGFSSREYVLLHEHSKQQAAQEDESASS